MAAKSGKGKQRAVKPLHVWQSVRALETQVDGLVEVLEGPSPDLPDRILIAAREHRLLRSATVRALRKAQKAEPRYLNALYDLQGCIEDDMEQRGGIL